MSALEPGRGVTAVVAQTKDAAMDLACELRIGDKVWAFGAQSAATFEGLRAALVIIDAAAQLEPGFLSTIRATVAKTGPLGGRVRFVSSDAPPPPSSVLRLAFWEALRRCDDDPRVHPMSHPWHDDGQDGSRIDGELPDELWEHMADVLADHRRGAR